MGFPKDSDQSDQGVPEKPGVWVRRAGLTLLTSLDQGLEASGWGVFTLWCGAEGIRGPSLSLGSLSWRRPGPTFPFSVHSPASLLGTLSPWPSWSLDLLFRILRVQKRICPPGVGRTHWGQAGCRGQAGLRS